MSTEHHLKTLASYWDRVESGEKTFEVRQDDRGFQKGDVLVLQKVENDSPHYYVPEPGKTTGCAKLRRRVGWILTGGQFGIEPGYVVMSLVDEDA